MALAAINITIGQSLGGGNYSSSVKGASVPNFSVVTTDTATLIADNVAVTPVENAVATLETDVAALVAANVAVTPVENAVATLEADGATPTQAHVTALRGVWDTLSAACTTHNGDANTVNSDKTALRSAWNTLSAACTTHNSDANTANTVATTLSGTINGDVSIIWNGSTITHRNQLRQALRTALAAVEAGYGGLGE